MEKAFKVILAALFLFSQVSLADCPEDVQVIEKDQKANCTGFLFSPKAEKEAALAIDENQYLKKVNIQLERRKEASDQESEILTKRLVLYVGVSKDLAEQNVSSEHQKLIYFGLGIIVTGVAIYGARQLQQR